MPRRAEEHLTRAVASFSVSSLMRSTPTAMCIWVGLGWAAGMFAYNDGISETPKKTHTGYQDVPLVKECVAGKFKV